MTMEHKTACKRKPWLLNEMLKLGSEHPLDLVRGNRHFAILFKSESTHYLTDGEHSIKVIFPRPLVEVFPTAVYILSYAYYITMSVNDYQCSSFFIEIEIYQRHPCSSECLDNADHDIEINTVPQIKQVLFHCLIGALPYSPMIFYYDDAEENLSVLANLVRESHELSSTPSPCDQLMRNELFTALRRHHQWKDNVQVSSSQNEEEISLLQPRTTQNSCVRARSKSCHHPQPTGRGGKANLQPFTRRRYKSKTLQNSGGKGKKTGIETLVEIQTKEQGSLPPSQNDVDSQEATDKPTPLSSDRVHTRFHNSPVKFSTECYDSCESLFTDSDKSMREDKQEKASLIDAAPQSSHHTPPALHSRDEICPHAQENIDCTSARRAGSQDVHQEKKLTENSFVVTLRTPHAGSVKFGSCLDHDNSETVQLSMSDDSSVGGSESLFSDSSQETSETEGGTLESESASLERIKNRPVSATSPLSSRDSQQIHLVERCVQQKELKGVVKEGENEERRTMSMSITESIIFEGNLASGFSSSSNGEKSGDVVEIKYFTKQRKCEDDTEGDGILSSSQGFEVSAL